MARTIITKGLVFDGTGSPPVPGEVTLDDDRVVSVTSGYRDDHSTDNHGPGRVIDATGCTVMPGLIESHGHLTFPSAVGHIDPSFNPPLDVSFFHHIQGMDAELARAERNAKILLDAGFTSVYSAGLPAAHADRGRSCATRSGRAWCPARGCWRPAWSGTTTRSARTATWSRSGRARTRAARSSASRPRWASTRSSSCSPTTTCSSRAARRSPSTPRKKPAPRVSRPGSPGSGSTATPSPRSRSRSRCAPGSGPSTTAPTPTPRPSTCWSRSRTRCSSRPAPGIIYANVYEGADYGIDRAQAEKMGSVAALEGMAAVYPEIRKRGIRALPGGDYGFPNNPIGRNARDLELFTTVLGYQPLEALTAATKYGGQLMGMGDELGLLAPGYLADVLVVAGEPGRRRHDPAGSREPAPTSSRAAGATSRPYQRGNPCPGNPCPGNPCPGNPPGHDPHRPPGRGLLEPARLPPAVPGPLRSRRAGPGAVPVPARRRLAGGQPGRRPRPGPGAGPRRSSSGSPRWAWPWPAWITG